MELGRAGGTSCTIPFSKGGYHKCQHKKVRVSKRTVDETGRTSEGRRFSPNYMIFCDRCHSLKAGRVTSGCWPCSRTDKAEASHLRKPA